MFEGPSSSGPFGPLLWSLMYAFLRLPATFALQPKFLRVIRARRKSRPSTPIVSPAKGFGSWRPVVREFPLDGARVRLRATFPLRDEPVTAKECRQRRYVVRNRLKCPVCTLPLPCRSKDLVDTGNPEHPPPVAVESGLRVFASFMKDMVLFSAGTFPPAGCCRQDEGASSLFLFPQGRSFGSSSGSPCAQPSLRYVEPRQL
jgi:hypothetical protein